MSEVSESGSNQSILAKYDSGLRWLTLLSSFTIKVHREGKRYNPGTISPLNKKLLETRCLVAI